MRSSEVSEYPTNEQLSRKIAWEERIYDLYNRVFNELYSKIPPMDETFL